MTDNISFTISDGLIIRGTFLENKNSSDLVIMLHSGGYDRRERGVKCVLDNKKVYYNALGNYEYLSSYLANDANILLLDQRNHGASGKNIDASLMAQKLKKISSAIDSTTIAEIIQALKAKDKTKLSKIVSGLDVSSHSKTDIQELIKHPIIKDMSFLEMAQDLNEIITSINSDKKYNIHLVGTCMGGLVSALYLINYPNDVKSLTLFSPLYTFDPVFLHPANEFNIRKHETIAAGKQYHMGNAVEGAKTMQEIAEISKTFYEKFGKLNIPIFCIQGVEDKLVPASYQNAIFKAIKDYHDSNNLSPIYYAEIYPGVHCLYDVLFPSLIEVSNFISGNLTYPELKK